MCNAINKLVAKHIIISLTVKVHQSAIKGWWEKKPNKKFGDNSRNPTLIKVTRPDKMKKSPGSVCSNKLTAHTLTHNVGKLP